MTPEQYGNLKRLAKKYRIQFDGPLPPDQWPSSHADLFRNIQLLGQKKHNEYKADKINHSKNEPWRAQTARRAERVVAIAKRLRSENRNEAGWRLELEPEIFSRFTVEVACPQCRARIWRSEIEASVRQDNSAKTSLEDRRKRREACRCEPISRHQDLSDPGLNPLFSDRAEELVIHDNIIHPDLPKQEHPDRVYGLRETKVLERALIARIFSHGGKATQVRDAIRYTPFRQNSDPLLYPFLILEAKSEKGQDSFDSIEKQTSFPIRTLLQLQEELQNHCQREPAWQHGPTVWFLANKGDEWRVSASFVEKSGETSSYRIVDLWQGRTVSEDGALQLLLIIDHIFDWARDIYRIAVWRHLKYLSEPFSNDANSLTHDTDIFSMNYPPRSFVESESGSEDNEMEESEIDELSDELRPMRLLDSPEGVVRDAALVEYKFLSFTVTGDSARTVMQSFLPAQAIRFSRAILSALRFEGGSFKVDGETLEKLERMWTGEARYMNPLNARKVFYTRTCYKTWLTDNWVIVKQLSCLAVAEDAIEVLTEQSTRLKTPRIPCHHTIADQIIDLYRPFKQCTTDYNLRAAVSRLALSSYVAFVAFWNIEWIKRANEAIHWIPAPRCPQRGKSEGGSWYGLAEEMTGDPTHALIDGIYRRHQIGRREPSEIFLRKSTFTDTRYIDIPHRPDPCPVPGDKCLGHRKSHVIVIGSCVQRSLWTANSPPICLFIRSREQHNDKNLAALRSLVGQMLERSDCPILTTCRYGASKHPSSMKWNIKDAKSALRSDPRINIWLRYLRDMHGTDCFSKVKDVLESPADKLPPDLWNPQSRVEDSPETNTCMGTTLVNPPSLKYQVKISDQWVDQ